MTENDSSLLRRYVIDRSETAFAELVRRHVDLVHSAALRQVGGDAHRAQDVTQAVFCELARKAPHLLQHRALSGWLYTTARFVGARLWRRDLRRNARELAAQAIMDSPEQPAMDPTWTQVQPIVDEVMAELPEKDRHAIVLRFFENKPLAEVGAAIGLSENAARMRVDRAMEKLRSLLARRGITSSTSLLGAVLAANAVAPAPTGLAAAVLGPALATAVAGGVTGPSAFALLNVMNTAKIGIAVGAFAFTSGLGTYLVMEQSNAELKAQLAVLQRQAHTPIENGPASPTEANEDELARLRAEHNELLRLRGEVNLLRQDGAELARLRAQNNARDQSRAGQEERRIEPIEGFGIAKMTFAKAWGLALLNFAQANGGSMPATFQEAARFFPTVPEEWKWSISSFSPDDFEIVFHGLINEIEHPERTIVVREKQPFDVQPSGVARRTYLFADGHTEVHRANNGDFEKWEKEHMVAAN
jgi:RNA polymerase sigma factor (sigma-70 family)